MLSPSIKLPTMDLKLTADEIHIWSAVLDQPVSRLHKFIQTLSIEERIRAEKFYFERDRKGFIVRRGILRTILGFYLNCESSLLQFRYGKNGKPELADTFGNGTVQFNLSHSDGVALFAFARDREIGVDIESIRDFPEMTETAKEIFSGRENDVLNALPESKKVDAFFRCWTLKEAFIKAIGEGLSYPLDAFDVPVAPGDPAEILRIRGDAREAARWSIQDLEVGPGFAAAFALRGRTWRLHRWQWSG